MDHAACAQHPHAPARACTRCGTFACNDCLAGGERSEPLCTACDEHVADQHSRPIAAAARYVRAGLLAHAGFALAGAVGVVAFGMPSDDDLGQQLLILASAIGSVVGAVAWCVWFRRANGSLGARGMQLQFGPNAWGWFFVPIAFWFKPYQSVVELYTRALAEPVAPPWVPLWWGLWVLANLVSPSSWNTADFTPLQVTRDVAGTLLGAGAALFAQHLVKLITQGLSASQPASALLEPSSRVISADASLR